MIAAAGSSVGELPPVKQRPYGTQHIQDYCRRHTSVYYHDFNARMVHKRRLRLQVQAASKQVGQICWCYSADMHHAQSHLSENADDDIYTQAAITGLLHVVSHVQALCAAVIGMQTIIPLFHT